MPSGLSPLLGAVEDFFSHIKLSAKNGTKLASERKGILQILSPSFKCSNGFVLREGPLLWSSIRIHDVTMRKGEAILSLR